MAIKVLETVATTKSLRISLSHDLRWNDHVNEITTNANKTLNFLCCNLCTCSAKSKEQAYKALVRLIVEYSAKLRMYFEGVLMIIIIIRTALCYTVVQRGQTGNCFCLKCLIHIVTVHE